MRFLSKILKCAQVVYEKDSAAGNVSYLNDRAGNGQEARREAALTAAQAAAAGQDFFRETEDNAAIHAMIKNAQREAGLIIQEAEKSAIQILESAKQRGYDEGRTSGFEAGSAEGRRQIEEYEQAGVQELQTLIDRYEKESEEKARSAEDSLMFAFGLAEKILGIEINRDDEAFLGLFQQAAGRIGEVSKVTLRVGDRGYDVAVRNREKLIQLLGGLENIKIEKSEKDSGACILETPQGTVDSGVKAQLGRAKEIVDQL